MKSAAWAIPLFLILLVAPVFGQAWKSQIDDALGRTKTYEFTNVSLVDVFRILSQDAEVNLIIDNGARIDPTSKLTLSVKDMSIGSALSWVTRLSKLQWIVQDEAIFVTRYERLSMAARREVDRREAERAARAQSTWLPAMDEKLTRKWSVTFEDKTLGDCRDALKVLMGINIIIASDVDQKKIVNLNVSRMTGESIISWLARNAGIDYVVMDEAVCFEAADEVRLLRFAGLDLSASGRSVDLVTFEFADIPLDEAVRRLSELSGVNIVIKGTPGVMPRITLSGKQMPLTAALRAVVSKSGLNAAILPEADMVVVTFMKPAPVPDSGKSPEPGVTVPASQSTDSAVKAIGI